MSAKKRPPLATVEHQFLSWRRAGEPIDPMPGPRMFAVKEFPRVVVGGAPLTHKAEADEAAINAAVEAREAPLLALLAECRRIFASTVVPSCSPGAHSTPADAPCESCMFAKWMNDCWKRIDAESPGEWVPFERLRECQRVLDDLRQETANVWRERCEMALKALRASSALAVRWQNAEAILAGRIEPWDASGSPDTSDPGPRLPAIHRGFSGDE